MIWRIHPTAGGTLIGEERQIDEKRAFFFCLDRENGQELWHHASPGDEWWIGIEAVDRDTVFLHGFANPNLPLHRGIIAVDVLTGKKLWEDQALEFIGTGDDFVIGSRDTSAGRSFEELDRRSGEKRRALDSAGSRALNVSRTGFEVEVTVPLPLEQFAAGDTRIEAVVRSHLGSGALAGSVEVVDQGKFLVFDFHEGSEHGPAEGQLLKSAITVLERDTGTVVYSDTVSTGMNVVMPQLFFVQHETLYYIKERQALMAVHLTS